VRRDACITVAIVAGIAGPSTRTVSSALRIGGVLLVAGVGRVAALGSPCPAVTTALGRILSASIFGLMIVLQIGLIVLHERKPFRSPRTCLPLVGPRCGINDSCLLAVVEPSVQRSRYGRGMLLIRDGREAEQLVRIALGVCEAGIHEHGDLRVLRYAVDELQSLLPIPLNLSELLL